MEIVGSEYRPGVIRIGHDQLVLSVSRPTFKLAETIAPQALMAWDPRLLSTARHLTLIISGIRGVYPVLLQDGTINPTAGSFSNLAFKVGLTPRYKPDKELVVELSRSFGLDGRKAPTGRTSDKSTHLEDSLNKYDDMPWDRTDQEQSETEEEDEEEEELPEESFSFSLSSSLEALMNDRFLGILQIRLKFGLGWAGAEAGLSKSQRSQRRIEDVVHECYDVKVFRRLMHSYILTLLPGAAARGYRRETVSIYKLPSTRSSSCS